LDDNTFYDIHMHAMNLSHPYLLAFIQRLKIHQYLLINSVLGPFASILVGKNLGKVKNLLAVMENDIGSFFLMIEDYLKRSDTNPLVINGKLNIGGNSYSKIVLTPLMMDFGYKNIPDDPNTYYKELANKPIVEQVMDVFNGISKYRNTRPDGMFEIYPFLGINTKNYDIGRIEKMMDKYFRDYKGSRQDFQNNMGNFDGNIENLGSNSFAGVKLYPPLGFDPWPDDAEELEKCEYIYNYCCQKNIPVTVHGSEGGFVAVSKQTLKEYASISKWDSVLSHETYSGLKLNLAHFPLREKTMKLFPKTRRLKEILELVSKYDNVYVDFSNRAINSEYYTALKNVISEAPENLKEKLKTHVLFGSDFTINLLSIESYNKYLEIFADDSSFDSTEKNDFCSANPARFLFSR
jgi:hypothetical protein